MPFQKLQFRPGLNVQRTQLLNEGGWSLANLIRFREGMAEVLGGWLTLGVATLAGIPRGIHAWTTLAGVPTLAVGTNVRLYVIQSATITTPTNPFSTISGNSGIIVTDSGAPPGLVVGTTIVVNGATTVGGLTLGGTYTINTVFGPTQYGFAATSNATSTATGGGTPTIQYFLGSPAAFDITPEAFGTVDGEFSTTISSNVVKISDMVVGSLPPVGAKISISGASPIGGLTLSGGYLVTGTFPTYYTIQAASAATSTAGPSNIGATISYFAYGPPGTGTTNLPAGPPYAQVWTLDNFGEQLIACPRGGGLYVWIPENGGNSPATLITQAPFPVNGCFVSNGAEQVIIYGSPPAEGGAFDPMLVSWCNSGDYTTWVASATNDAGNFPLTDGSQIMWGGRAAQQNLLWTDTALYAMQFIGGELVYAFQQLGTGCGMIGPQAAGIVNGVAFWMSRLNFMMYNGTVGVVDCPVRDDVFKNIDTNQSWKVFCGVNSQFNEIRWDFPSATGSGENDTFVIFNYVENTWTYGSDTVSGITVARTCWEDVSPFGTPIGFDQFGNGWQHEIENVYSAGTVAVPWSLTSGFVDIAAGEQMMFVDWCIPDQILTVASGTGVAAYEFSVQASRYPGDSATTTGNIPVLANTESIYPRIRGRQVAFTFQSAKTAGAINTFWRMGAVRIRAAPDGRN